MSKQAQAKSEAAVRSVPRKAVRALAVTALMAALGVALRLLIFYIGGHTLRVSFVIVPVAFTGMLLGAPYAVAAAVLADVLGYFMFPSGGNFFPGFTVTAALEGLVCGLVLHRKPQSLIHIILCALLLAVPLHGFLNNYWHAVFLTPAAYFPTLALRLLKEAVLLPVYAAIFWVMAKFALPPVRRMLSLGGIYKVE